MALGLLVREVGRTVAPVPVYPALVLGALPLAQFGTEEQKKTWLPGIASGECILTAALSEFESSDPRTPATRAETRADGYRLSGIKTNVPYAAQAARILVPARFDDGSIGLFFVEPTRRGRDPRRADDAGWSAAFPDRADGRACRRGRSTATRTGMADARCAGWSIAPPPRAA